VSQLHQCNEQLKEDKVKRWEALQEISTTQHLLKLKSEVCLNYTTSLDFRSFLLHRQNFVLSFLVCLFVTGMYPA